MSSMNPAPMDAVALLEKDHRTVEKLFRQWEGSDNVHEKSQLASRICQALSIHAEIEETLFYPQALVVLGDDGDNLVWEASVEHGTLRGLIQRLDGQHPGEPAVDAHLTVLMEYVKHHVREEEGQLFPAVRKAGLDLRALGAQLADLKQRLEDRVATQPRSTADVVHLVDVSTPERGRAARFIRDALGVHP